jgi:hypothetical protein
MIIDKYSDFDTLLKEVKTIIPEIKSKTNDREIEVYFGKKLLISSKNQKDVNVFLTGVLNGLNIFVAKFKE